jgi:hypothetical protein
MGDTVEAPEASVEDSSGALLRDLVAARRYLQGLGVAVTLTTIAAAAARRQMRPLPSSQLHMHRGKEKTLGRSAMRRVRLTWQGFEQNEDGYSVVVTHGETVIMRAETRQRACAVTFEPQAGQTYRWTIEARAGQRTVEQQDGEIWFLEPAEEQRVAEHEQECRALPEGQRLLALGSLYEEAELYWEAAEAYHTHAIEHPHDAVGPMLLAECYEQMGRLQASAAAMTQANQLLGS